LRSAAFGRKMRAATSLLRRVGGRGAAAAGGGTLLGRRWLCLPPHSLLPMPALSPTMTQGNLVTWKKKEGDSIEAGDVIAEVETDKATVDYEAVDDGILAKILVPEGTEDVLVGTSVAVVVDEAGDVGAFADYVPSSSTGNKAELAPAKPAPAPAPAPAPSRKKDTEAAAAAAAAAGGGRTYEEEALSVEDATAKLAALSDTRVRPALDLMGKMMANVSKAPAEPKYRRMRLSNKLVAEGLVHVPGARQFLVAHGWRIVEREFLELPPSDDPAAQAAAQAAAVAALTLAVAQAQEERRRAELEARKREAAERVAKQKADREAMKAAMARDRAEVAARGPAQASVAKKLPTESAGSMSSAIFQEQEEAEARANAR